MIEKLNNILKNENESDPICLEDLIFIESLVDIVLNVDIPNYNFEYKENVPLDISIHHSKDFLQTIDERYLENLCYLTHDKKMFCIPDNPDITQALVPALVFVHGEKFIRMVYNNNIGDAYSIVHEVFHYINTSINKISFNWELMTETISFVAEGLLKNYFMNCSTHFIDYKINDRCNMYSVKIIAYKLDFEVNLIKIYKKYGFIDDYIIKVLLQNKSDEYINAVYDDIQQMLNYNEMNFNSLQRFVVAAIISTHILKRIKSDPKKISEFIYINDNCYEMNFVDTLKMLDLSFDDEDIVILSKDSLNQLRNQYRNKVLELR